MCNFPHLRQVKFTPVNAQVIAAASPYTSAAFSLNGYNQLDCYVSLTRNAATALTFTLFLSDDEAAAAVYQATSAATVGGVTTLTNNTVTIAIAATGTFHFAFTGLNAASAKLKVASTNGDTDVVTVKCIKAVI